MPTTTQAHDIEALRGFNRFYTRHIGVLESGLLRTSFTLTQARVLFELGTRQAATAGEIAALLGLDLGYLSRIVQDFAARGLVSRKRAAEDGRRIVLALTAKGRKAFAALDTRSREHVALTLQRLPSGGRGRLLAALREVQGLLAPASTETAATPTIRRHAIGDIGWAIERHARLYAEEYGWNDEFEALVTTLFARFVSRRDPAREDFWIAELDGDRVGCTFVAANEDDPTLAQLRCLLVEPRGRGRGVGRALVDRAIAFARAAGYRGMVLWTYDILAPARQLYESSGFRLAESAPAHAYGADLVSQIWRLDFQ